MAQEDAKTMEINIGNKFDSLISLLSHHKQSILSELQQASTNSQIEHTLKKVKQIDNILQNTLTELTMALINSGGQVQPPAPRIQKPRALDMIAQYDSDYESLVKLLQSASVLSIVDKAMGLCIGAAIGDSLGSFCEFSKTARPSETMEIAMMMIGGGPHDVEEGQVTDDTELAICLANGLVKMVNRKNTQYDSSIIAKEYEKWFNSDPFDVGACTRNTLCVAPQVTAMKQAAVMYNNQCIEIYQQGGNLANGSLMRCMPLIVYGYKLSNHNLAKIMIEDSSLSHANDIVYVVNSMYAIGVRYLLLTDIKEVGRNIKAINVMKKWLEHMENKTVLGWYNEIDFDNVASLHKATKSIAFIKIAFQRIFYHLHHASMFRQAMHDVVKEGGDTDTNACIIGGIMGAYWGIANIPVQYVNKIRKCQVRVKKHMTDRSLFQAKWYLEPMNKIKVLLNNAPTNEAFTIKRYHVDENVLTLMSKCNQCNQIKNRNEGAIDASNRQWYCDQCWALQNTYVNPFDAGATSK
eukprot:520008_1